MTTEATEQEQAIRFPIPFAGINRTLELAGDRAVETDDLLEAIEGLVSCDHDHKHNFAVELGHDKPRIWTTELGGACVLRAILKREPEDGELLTIIERRLIDTLDRAWDQFNKVVDDGENHDADLEEIASKLHDLQHAVMSQAAARRYPETYRLLGESLS